MGITYCESLCVALGIQYAMRTRHIVMWHVRLYNIFPHYLTKGMILEYIYIYLYLYTVYIYIYIYETCVLTFCTTFV
jgi:hypothetical protein